MLELSPISVPKAADVLADVLRERILGGELKERSDLPSERDLSEQAGVSRATVRETLRILEGEGLIETRVGRNGGSTVSRPGSDSIERSVGIFIRGQGIRFEAVLETRAAIEPASARFAAAHRTDADLEELERCHERLKAASRNKDTGAYIRANLDWHVQVVRASHNELLIAFIAAVSRAVYLENDIEGFSSPTVRAAVIHAHQRVMDAILAGDGDAAERRMARHVSAYVASVRQAAKAPRKVPTRRRAVDRKVEQIA